MGKSTIQGAIFNSYVKLPEGIRDGYSSENGDFNHEHMVIWVNITNTWWLVDDDYRRLDYCTQIDSLLGITIIQGGNPYKPTSISWNNRGVLNSAHMGY